MTDEHVIPVAGDATEDPTISSPSFVWKEAARRGSGMSDKAIREFQRKYMNCWEDPSTSLFSAKDLELIEQARDKERDWKFCHIVALLRSENDGSRYIFRGSVNRLFFHLEKSYMEFGGLLNPDDYAMYPPDELSREIRGRASNLVMVDDYDYSPLRNIAVNPTTFEDIVAWGEHDAGIS